MVLPKYKAEIGSSGLVGLIVLLVIFFLWQGSKKPATEGNWQPQLAIPSTAEFHGNEVTIHNVRNFRYYPAERNVHPAYYDRTYSLNQIAKIWYVTEPFNELKIAAHTFLSFEFANGDFLSITIEARKTKSQTYSIWKGMLRTYPLIYIAADERDVVLLRANLRKDRVYIYPVKLSKPENARSLFTDMLERMNDLQIRPQWYNGIWANCTSVIADHVNRVTPGRISPYSWQLRLTSSADELALSHGLLDTSLSIGEARKKYFVTEKSLQVGDTPNYSQLIRLQPN